MSKSNKGWWIAGMLCAVAGQASATNGYFMHGYGEHAKGRGGVSVAMTDDAMGGANNPATMVWAGDRLDLGVDYFRPIRSTSRTNSAIGLSVDSESTNFFIPEIGYNKMLSPNMSVGVSIYGNGGMNTDYPGGQTNCGAGAANALCGSGRLGMDLMQLMIAPTFSYKFNDAHSVGVSPLLGYQRFKAEGLQAFAQTGANQKSSDPNAVTNNGYDSSTGAGLRLGYYGKLSDMIGIGVSYSTKMKMSKFDKYKGLFAEQGSLDIPENYALGITVKPVANVEVGFEYQRINYSGVASISNPSTNQVPLGSDNGPGFGWGDVDVYKLGVNYAYSQNLTLRSGFSHNKQPIGSRDVTFNIIAPGVVQDHLSFGFSYKLDKASELSMSYTHAFEKSVTGASILPGGGTETIRMSQDILGVTYSMLF